jgi:hypothetical protein
VSEEDWNKNSEKKKIQNNIYSRIRNTFKKRGKEYKIYDIIYKINIKNGKGVSS